MLPQFATQFQRGTAPKKETKTIAKEEASAAPKEDPNDPGPSSDLSNAEWDALISAAPGSGKLEQTWVNISNIEPIAL